MAIVDIDRHILSELIVLQDKMDSAKHDFRIAWDDISDVRSKTECIVLDRKDANDPQLPKLRDRITRAMKICNTKMLMIDDCSSRQKALFNHLVTEVREADSGKGRESHE